MHSYLKKTMLLGPPLLDKLQNQGIQQISLVVTDGFKGLEQIISQAHPLAKQQCCLIHISRNLASKVKRADRSGYSGAIYNDLSC